VQLFTLEGAADTSATMAVPLNPRVGYLPNKHLEMVCSIRREARVNDVERGRNKQKTLKVCLEKGGQKLG